MAAYLRIGEMVILAIGAVYKLISKTCDSENDFGHGFGVQEDDSGVVQDYSGSGRTVLRDDPGDGFSLHVQDGPEYYHNDGGCSLQDENEDDGFSLQDDFSGNLLDDFIYDVGLSDENFRNDWRSTAAEDECFGTHPRSAVVKGEEEVETQSVAKRIKHYSSTQRILLVGEGNFSFSACLAKAFGSATNMVATSLNSYEFVLRNYAPGGWLNLTRLKEKGCKVIHKVNATKMASHVEVGSMTFDIIVYNFPHAGFKQFESRASELKRHRGLLRGFFKNAKRMLSNDGEIHVTHKTNGFFAEWRIEDLAAQCGLHVIEKTNFRLSDYPGYETKYGFGGNKNFYCNPSMTYKFALSAKMSTWLGSDCRPQPGTSPHPMSYDPLGWFHDVDISDSIDDDIDYVDQLALSFYFKFERNLRKLERRNLMKEREGRGVTN